MVGEKLAYFSGFDTDFLPRHNISCALGCQLPIIRLKENKILIEVLKRPRYTTKKRLIVSTSSKLSEAYSLLDGNVWEPALQNEVTTLERFEAWEPEIVLEDANTLDCRVLSVLKRKPNGVIDQ